MAKRLSESRMHQLWRKAVLIKHNKSCAFCGSPGPLECHHIVRRRKLLTRWDWKNGIALCPVCHREAHTMRGQMRIAATFPWWGYLEERENRISKEVFADLGITAGEWYYRQAEEMRDIINTRS